MSNSASSSNDISTTTPRRPPPKGTAAAAKKAREANAASSGNSVSPPLIESKPCCIIPKGKKPIATVDSSNTTITPPIDPIIDSLTTFVTTLSIEESSASNTHIDIKDSIKLSKKPLLEMTSTESIRSIIDEGLLGKHNNDSLLTTVLNGSQSIKSDLHIIVSSVDKSISPLKAVIVSVLAKITNPDWDTRNHQTGLGTI